MYQKETTVKNSTGLHARPASDFVKAAKEFESKIKIMRSGSDEDEAVNAKSIVMLLSLGVGKGEKIVVSATGYDEEKAVDTLVELIDSGFGEE